MRSATAWSICQLPQQPCAAAELWAQARQQGQQTAGDKNLDADMILIAQTLVLDESDVVIATTNTRHLARFTPAALWQDII